MPLANLKVVSKKLLEAKYFATLQICLFEAVLPRCDHQLAELLREHSSHCDVASCQQHVTLHGVVFRIEHARAHHPFLLLCVESLHELVRSALSQNSGVDAFLELVDQLLLLLLMNFHSVELLV